MVSFQILPVPGSGASCLRKTCFAGPMVGEKPLSTASKRQATDSVIMETLRTFRTNPFNDV